MIAIETFPILPNGDAVSRRGAISRLWELLLAESQAQRAVVFEDYKESILAATSVEQLTERLTGLDFTAFNADERGLLENLIADRHIAVRPPLASGSSQ